MGGREAPTGPAAPGDRPGATAVPASPGAPVPRGGQSFGCAQNTNEASRGPRPCPLQARTGRGPSPPPLRRAPPPEARAGGRGRRREQRIRRPSPALRPAAPRARPRGHAAPRSPRPRAPARGPARPRVPGGGHRAAGTQPGFFVGFFFFLLRAPEPAHPRGGGKREPWPAPAALAPRRLPARARRLRFEAPAAMIAGSGARALGPSSGTPGRPTVQGLAAALRAPRTAAGVAGLILAGASVRPGALDWAPAQSSGWSVATGFPRGKARARAIPRARQSEGLGAQRSRGQGAGIW